MKTGVTFTNKAAEKAKDRRSKGVNVRLSEDEKKRLKELSQQSGVSVSQLLRSGALGYLHRLPRFRQLPAEVTAVLSKLDRLTTALVYLSQRAESDTLFAQDIRAMVYGVGEIIAQVNQFCADNMTSFGTVSLVDNLIQEAQRTPNGDDTLGSIIRKLQALRIHFQTDKQV